MILRSSPSTFGIAGRVDDHDPLPVAMATVAVEEMWSPTQTRIAVGIEPLDVQGRPATSSATAPVASPAAASPP